MSSLGIFDKETKTYKKVADLSKPAVIDSAMSDTSTNAVQNNVIKNYVDGTFKQKLLAQMPGDGKTSYCQLCTIKITQSWVNAPIEITVQERGRATLDRLTVSFDSVYNNDPNLISFNVFGGFDGWYISKRAASTWVIYGQKNEPWGYIRVVDYIGVDGINVAWDVTGVTALPDSRTKAVWGGNVNYAVNANSAEMITGFSYVTTGQLWGVQTGTFIAGMDDDSGGSLAFRKDCPSSGKVSEIIDGYFYQNEGNYRCLDTSDYEHIQGEIDNLKKSVSDGKTKVANAITDKGVETATDATFATMAGNISKITTGTKLNLYTQTSEPSKKDGIWVKTSNQYKKAIVDNSILSSGRVWSNPVSDLPYDFHNGSAVVYNEEIHILGSYYGPSIATAHYKWNGSSWTKASTLPCYFYASPAVVYNGEIHILGGSSNANITGSKNYHYKWNGSSWTNVSTLPYNFIVGSAVVYNGEIHILGGNGNNTAHYKWNGSSWTNVSTLPYDFRYGKAVVYNWQSIYILGSENTQYRKYRATFTSESKTYDPYTLIIQRGDTNNGAYVTAFADMSAIAGSNNRFQTGFDDVWYFGSSAFETTPIYYGDGSKWIKFKN